MRACWGWGEGLKQHWVVMVQPQRGWVSSAHPRVPVRAARGVREPLAVGTMCPIFWHDGNSVTPGRIYAVPAAGIPLRFWVPITPTRPAPRILLPLLHSMD